MTAPVQRATGAGSGIGAAVRVGGGGATVLVDAGTVALDCSVVPRPN